MNFTNDISLFSGKARQDEQILNCGSSVQSHGGNDNEDVDEGESPCSFPALDFIKSSS